jgi:hypothetical protein
MASLFFSLSHLTQLFSQRERNEGRSFLEISALPDLYLQEGTEAMFSVKDNELAC